MQSGAQARTTAPKKRIRRSPAYNRRRRRNTERILVALVLVPAGLLLAAWIFYYLGNILLQAITVWRSLLLLLGLPPWILTVLLLLAGSFILAGVVSVRRMPTPKLQVTQPPVEAPWLTDGDRTPKPVLIDFSQSRNKPPAEAKASKEALRGVSDQTAHSDHSAFGGEAVQLHKTRRATPLPPLNLLEQPTKLSFASTGETQSIAQKIQNILDTFSIGGRVANTVVGPHVIRFEVELLPGTRVSTVTARSQDFAVRLGIPELRIDAPVAGKPNTVAIEVPSPRRQVVRLSNLLQATDRRFNMPLPIGLTVEGKPIVEDLTKMPHLLVAGATGAGKSVALHSFIVSMLVNFRPDELRLVLADPKHVEFSFYQGLPHLLYPVINNPQQVLTVLKELAAEMEERYRILSQSRTRSIVDYNRVYPDDKIPIIAVVVDEMADIMLTAPSEMEHVVAVLASKARAAGIHLILATQRPSVDVITGLIKANIPHRIAFAVSSQVDSRVILDVGGAERLIGAGDFLYSNPAVMKPIRGQSPFISEAEIVKVVDFWKDQALEVELREIPIFDAVGATNTGDNDPLLPEVIGMLKGMDRVSTSLVQRRFKIGYNRAARILETLEEKGFVGPLEGARGRKVIRR
ncbi:DNA translocase FtsK [Coprothermobacteraceae bacterium]|nr:DNA translocase FtsK [Coprothermobacteraceae bacterium]